MLSAFSASCDVSLGRPKGAGNSAGAGDFHGPTGLTLARGVATRGLDVESPEGHPPSPVSPLNLPSLDFGWALPGASGTPCKAAGIFEISLSLKRYFGRPLAPRAN